MLDDYTITQFRLDAKNGAFKTVIQFANGLSRIIRVQETDDETMVYMKVINSKSGKPTLRV